MAHLACCVYAGVGPSGHGQPANPAGAPEPDEGLGEDSGDGPLTGLDGPAGKVGAVIGQVEP
jgi:hypothetical protein